MLHETPSEGTQARSPMTGRRSIDQILARRESRLRKRHHAFPPDFVHGEVRLDEIYAAFGRRWVENALFIEKFYGDDGELVAWTAARFEDRFLIIEQGLRDESPRLQTRLEELVDERRSVVELRVDRRREESDERDLTVNCSLARLVFLEQNRLGVVRDREFSDPRCVYSQRDDVLQDSRTNMLSLICLCARLAR